MTVMTKSRSQAITEVSVTCDSATSTVSLWTASTSALQDMPAGCCGQCLGSCHSQVGIQTQARFDFM